MARTAKSPYHKSPYQRYKKRPYRYSDAYREWFKLKLAGNDEDAIERANLRHREFIKNNR